MGKPMWQKLQKSNLRTTSELFSQFDHLREVIFRIKFQRCFPVCYKITFYTGLNVRSSSSLPTENVSSIWNPPVQSRAVLHILCLGTHLLWLGRMSNMSTDFRLVLLIFLIGRFMFPSRLWFNNRRHCRKFKTTFEKWGIVHYHYLMHQLNLIHPIFYFDLIVDFSSPNTY